MFGVILFFLTLYLQNVLDLGPLAAGAVFLAFSVPLVVMSPVGGRLVSRFGSRDLMAVGMALVGVGMAFFALIDADSGIGLTLIGLVIAGFGQGFAYNISNTAGMESMPDDKAGIASGVLQTARLMGIVIGLALSGSLFSSLENRELLTQVHAHGATAAEESDVRGLLSGSAAAEQHVKTLTDQLPSELFRERVVLCYIDDLAGLEQRHRVGGDKICWESDYPHSDSTWPTSPEFAMRSFEAAGVPDDEVRAMTHENAMRHFRFDPFAYRPPEECTVGALRAGAADVDIVPRSVGKRAQMTKASDLLTAGPRRT